MVSKWVRIGFTLMFGLFIAYLDRTNLSVGLPGMSQSLGFAGASFAVTSSLALTTFLVGYAFANLLGGVLTQRFDPKPVTIILFAVWSLVTVLTGWVTSVTLLLVYRLILGIAEGVYWPQQSRFAQAWFTDKERTSANAIIQYYGQYLALALGFIILTPVYSSFGWQPLFFITGGIGLLVVVPIYLAMLRGEPEEKVSTPKAPAGRLSLEALGGTPFLLLVFSYLTQGMLFWGITLWIPLAVNSLGFKGLAQAGASAVPYIAAVVLAIPMTRLSDRTGQRVLIASLGEIIPGILLLLLGVVQDSGLRLALITIGLGFYASSYTPNIWAIIQSRMDRSTVGTAAGIVNGIGAGGGGTIAGWLVGLMLQATGSYIPGFVTLGGISIVGGIALLMYGRTAHSVAVSPRMKAEAKA